MKELSDKKNILSVENELQSACPTDEELVSWVYGEDSDYPDLEKHLLACNECRRKVQMMRETISALDDIDPLKDVENPEEGLNSALQELNQKLKRIEEEILDIGELFRYLKLPETEILELLPELPYFTVQGHIRFRLSAIREWIKNREDDASLRKDGDWDKWGKIVDISGYFAKNVV